MPQYNCLSRYFSDELVKDDLREDNGQGGEDGTVSLHEDGFAGSEHEKNKSSQMSVESFEGFIQIDCSACMTAIYISRNSCVIVRGLFQYFSIGQGFESQKSNRSTICILQNVIFECIISSEQDENIKLAFYCCIIQITQTVTKTTKNRVSAALYYAIIKKYINSAGCVRKKLHKKNLICLQIV